MNKQNILIGGGSGLIGSRLIDLLKHNFNIHILTRKKSHEKNGIFYHQWDLDEQVFDLDSSVSFDAIINLTGAGIADKRWSKDRKKVLIDSRVKSVYLMEKIIDSLPKKPNFYLGASAIGYYGDQGNDLLTEASDSGQGFLSECCVLWEKAHDLVKDKVNRFAVLRIGIVLSTQGGALEKLIPPARLGASGYFGNGQAYYPWIHIDDVCGMILGLVEDDSLQGAFNGSSQNPETLKTIAQKVKTVFAPYALVLPIPAIGLKLAMGEMSTMLLNSTRVISNRWADFPFKYPTLESALRDLKERKL